MTTELKKRQCLKCRTEKPIDNFKQTPSPFFPAHRSLICTSCYEKMVRPDDLDAVDALCRYLDLPFDLDTWTRLYSTNGEHTLSAYFETLRDDHYNATSWKEENERWRIAREELTIDEEVEALSSAKVRKLVKKWGGDYPEEDLLFLENFFNQIVATQNVFTPILKEYAKDLCEVELRIKKGLRAGVDVKKDMDARDNIIKMAKFDAANSKSAADFESVGELMVYYGKKGWKPNWHTEPQDSIDFLMKNIQTYLQRLVSNEGTFADQVEEKRKAFNTAEKIEELEDDMHFEIDEETIEYEDEEEAAADFSDWEVGPDE